MRAIPARAFSLGAWRRVCAYIVQEGIQSAKTGKSRRECNSLVAAETSAAFMHARRVVVFRIMTAAKGHSSASYIHDGGRTGKLAVRGPSARTAAYEAITFRSARIMGRLPPMRDRTCSRRIVFDLLLMLPRGCGT